MNDAEEEFGLETLTRQLEANPPTDPEKATEVVFEAVNTFAGETPQSDDITCLVLHCSEDAP